MSPPWLGLSPHNPIAPQPTKVTKLRQSPSPLRTCQMERDASATPAAPYPHASSPLVEPSAEGAASPVCTGLLPGVREPSECLQNTFSVIE